MRLPLRPCTARVHTTVRGARSAPAARLRHTICTRAGRRRERCQSCATCRSPRSDGTLRALAKTPQGAAAARPRSHQAFLLSRITVRTGEGAGIDSQDVQAMHAMSIGNMTIFGAARTALAQ